MNPGIRCCMAVGSDWPKRPVASSGTALSSAYVQAPGVYSCNPPGAGWAGNFHDCLTPGFYEWCNAGDSHLSRQIRVISWPSSHINFNFDTFIESICRWHVFGNSDASLSIQQLWGTDWESICSKRLPNFQCERTSQWMQLLLSKVGIQSRIVRVITAGELNTIGDISHVLLEVLWQGTWRIFDPSFNRISTVSAATMFSSRPRGPWMQVIPPAISPYNSDPTQSADIQAYQHCFVSGTSQDTVDWTERVFGVVGLEVGPSVYFRTVTAEEQAAYAAYSGKPANWIALTNLTTWLETCY
jgi:hypothetical protein